MPPTSSTGVFDDVIDPEAADPMTQAFIAPSIEGELFGLKLNPFAGRRMICAQTLGLALFSLSPEELGELKSDKEAKDELKSDKEAKDDARNLMYPGLFLDALKVGWIATRSDQEVSRAIMRPRAANESILEWAEENQVTFGSDAFIKVVEAFSKCLEHIGTSTPKESAGGLGKGEPPVSLTAT